MKRVRAMECACGHPFRVTEDNSGTKLGQRLFEQVREHVDRLHADLNLSNKDIWIMLAESAYTPSNSESTRN